MFDDLAAFFYENVVAAYTEYAETRQADSAGRSVDLRMALNAATSLYHLREHVPNSERKTRKQLAQKCPDYDLLGDVVNAAKHKRLTRGNPEITTAENIYEEIVITEYRDDKGPYRRATKQVTVELDDGSKRDLFVILTNVINLWADDLHDLGVLSKRPWFTLPSQEIPPRTSEDEAANLGLEVTRGVRFHPRFRLQRYNYDTGETEPIDLSDSKVKFSVYKPSYSADVTLDLETGESVTRTIDLSDKEALVLSELETDAEKQSFLMECLEERGLISRKDAKNEKERE